VVSLDSEGQAAQAVRAAHAEGSVHIIGRGRGRTLETVDRVVDLYGDRGPMLGIVGVRLRKDELPRQLGCGEGGKYRTVPVHLPTLPPAPGDQEAHEEGQEGDDHRQQNPAQRLGTRG